jgi:outer membrane protein
MKLSSLTLSLGVSIALLTTTASAANLVQVYNQALKSDPTFKQAHATFLSTKENLPIAEANLFPTLDLTAGVNRNYGHAKGGLTNGYYNNTSYGLTVNEPLFNMANWAGISSAKAAVKSATATYMAAAQNLMVRTAKSYFAVLQAADQLRYTIAQKNSVYRQLVTSRQKYKVGLIAVTPVYDAQASYDTAVANEITDRNALDNAIENLRAITGKEYSTLSELGKQVPLYIPQPTNINSWVSIALTQNYALKAQEYQLQADHELIEQSADARYPTIAAQASAQAMNYGNFHQVRRPNTVAGAIGLSLDFPVYQGGLITANTRQAEYNYLNSSATLELQHRTIVNQTRQSYLAVVAGISGIKADNQSVISNQNSMKATKAGYVVGTRTMVDVLQALSSLYQAQKSYSQDQYNYINSLINLKSQAGTLSVKDITQINKWLTKSTKLIKKPFNNTYTPAQPKIAPLRHNESRPARNPMPPKPHRTRAAKIVKASEGGSFTIQLFAGKTYGQASAFINQHHIMNAEVVEASVNGTAWFKVVTGRYTTHTAATTAIKHLPASLKTMQPWVTRESTSVKAAPKKVAMAEPQPNAAALPSVTLPSPNAVA